MFIPVIATTLIFIETETNDSLSLEWLSPTSHTPIHFFNLKRGSKGSFFLK